MKTRTFACSRASYGVILAIQLLHIMKLFDVARKLEITDIATILESSEPIVLTEEARQRIQAGRDFLEGYCEASTEPVYGINTGFGSLCNTEIAEADLEKLQRNLLLSHACGMGEEVPEVIVRLMILLKLRALSFGNSGVSVETVEQLIQLYNKGITPIVFQQGSLGASGDLAPLAHLCLPLIGEGMVRYDGRKMSSAQALQQCQLEPIQLKSKEGLALINGTQFMCAYAVYILIHGQALQDQALHVAAMSLDAFDGRTEPFHPGIHELRPHAGQRTAARRMLELLEGSEIAAQKKTHVQDPYSFRCIPQVHGASMDTLNYAQSVVETEINAVTDNPLLLPKEHMIVSGGHFHGQPLALVLDFLCIALAELGSISERRTYKLINGLRNLPIYLAPNAGLNSGFMIPQYTAASIVSQNKQLCAPCSVDTIDSSNGQEDHVSMGANAATKCFRVLENVKSIVAIEAYTAAQALEFKRPLKSSPAVEKLHASVRALVPFHDYDVWMHVDMTKIRELLG
ncbi:MAG: histidine ammonia-lyase [Flavobacteriales bacterium]